MKYRAIKYPKRPAQEITQQEWDEWGKIDKNRDQRYMLVTKDDKPADLKTPLVGKVKGSEKSDS